MRSTFLIFVPLPNLRDGRLSSGRMEINDRTHLGRGKMLALALVSLSVLTLSGCEGPGGANRQTTKSGTSRTI